MSFEEKKEDYLAKLCTHMDVVSTLLTGDDEATRKSASLLLMPSNENELRMADATLTLTVDLKDLVEAVSCDNVEKIPVEENEGINLILDIILVFFFVP